MAFISGYTYPADTIVTGKTRGMINKLTRPIEMLKWLGYGIGTPKVCGRYSPAGGS
jgi:hypothetical protein